MALNPAPGYLLVKPTGDNDEHERADGLHVITNEEPQRTVRRGVVIEVAAICITGIEPGHLVHYLDFHELHDLHVVWHGQVLAWEDEL